MPPLSPDRWRALSPYLDEALAMPADNRAAWLADIRARDAALGADLESLLADHEELQESPFLEGAPPRAPSSGRTGCTHSSVRVEWAASGWRSAAMAASKDARQSSC